MSRLMLAFEIAEVIEKAAHERAFLDVEAAAEVILTCHPEAETSRHEVIEVLREEARAAGVTQPSR